MKCCKTSAVVVPPAGDSHLRSVFISSQDFVDKRQFTDTDQ